jgi:hypothetical protein
LLSSPAAGTRVNNPFFCLPRLPILIRPRRRQFPLGASRGGRFLPNPAQPFQHYDQP